jgi:hypothetical protein
MNPGVRIYLGVVVGSIATLAAWAWLLSDGCSFGRLALGALLTAALAGAGSAWTIRAIPPVCGPNPSRPVSGLLTAALASAVIGLPILFWQTAPHPLWAHHETFLARRYSALFFGVSAYLALVQTTSNAWANRE